MSMPKRSPRASRRPPLRAPRTVPPPSICAWPSGSARRSKIRSGGAGTSRCTVMTSLMAATLTAGSAPDGGGPLQRTVEVGDEVAHVLEADRHPDRAVGDAHRGTRLGFEPAVSGRGGVRRQRLGVAEVVRDVDQGQGVHQRERRWLATVDLEGDDGASPAVHLAQRQLVLWVALE